MGAPGLVTSTVTTGDRYLAQPFILDNDTVVLKFGIGLSSLVNLVKQTASPEVHFPVHFVFTLTGTGTMSRGSS